MECYWIVELRYNAIILQVCCIYLWILKSMLLLRDLYTDDFSLPQGRQLRVLPGQQIPWVLCPAALKTQLERIDYWDGEVWFVPLQQQKRSEVQETLSQRSLLAHFVDGASELFLCVLLGELSQYKYSTSTLCGCENERKDSCFTTFSERE